MAQRWNSSARAEEAAQAHAFETMMSLQVRKAHLDLVTLVAGFLGGRPDKCEYRVSLGAIRGMPAQWISPLISPNLIFGTRNRRRQ
jgi:hypothetical protein